MRSVVITDKLASQAVATLFFTAILQQVLIMVRTAGVLVSANTASLALTLTFDEGMHWVGLASGLGSFTVVAVRGHCAPCLSLTERVLV